MTGYSDNARDRATANDTGHLQALMCTAAGCPNRWSCETGRGRLCSDHNWTDPHGWPRITQDQIDAETDRALLRNAAPPTSLAVDVRAVRDALQGYMLTRLGQRPMSREWANRLRDREQRGDSFTHAQREMWRAAIGAHQTLDRAVEGRPIATHAITRALHVTGDLPPGRDSVPWTDADIPAFEESA